MPEQASKHRNNRRGRVFGAYIQGSTSQPGAAILSEFYHLRRTAIKDLAAYIGFLAGFIGAAPFAWGLLASQLDSGTFVRGLWYFFGIVVAAGIFSGIAGLGLGFVGGLLWEQFHRHRRSERLKNKAILEASNNSTSETVGPPSRQSFDAPPPKLQLVGASSAAPIPNLAGRRIRAVSFLEHTVELDFGAQKVEIGQSAVVTCGLQKTKYPDPGSRDALCALIGARVDRMRAIAGERVEISCDNGCDLTIPRSGLAVA